ncbi:DUF4145 domain-containing protein [Arcobacter cryaerophilus gv. pseudocryaerophilus]|uniref:DUF4145 domain-containing protein n=3 Tax=Arcobacteraceae TaxID=2808963 RepID=A0AA96DVQ0_9BACT|nr:DUF4145 domain-containing protein [Aliarcobacter cryaerophilus]QNM92378.1 DUF4145 domain-containing protein [Aliarcobacter cryaerophilus]WNL34075.1 DUF4145 domain-containing protein [Arcobacter sp. AZ-2023]WNL36446.1 DUF4145 domain-containing protein [Arcobacter sp. AZ-2023]WPD12162.1 DUF4145 domain-containing protein [Arcobacter sp. DSM 115960]
MKNKISSRFKELLEEVNKIESSKKKISGGIYGTDYLEINNELHKIWELNLKNLILLLTSDSNCMYYSELVKISELKSYEDYSNVFDRQKALFLAFKDDYEKGLISSMKYLIEANVFDTELEQAKELLSNRYKLAAAVIGGVVLETALRSLCDKEKIEHGKLDKMNADLAKAGVYNKFQQKSITALADIRNSAAHGKDSEFTHENVENMIRDIESFLANYLN